MVRKLVLWKTNKDQSADDFPAYGVHLTDFSPNRKDPLSGEIRVSSSREQIEQLFNQFKTENIVKGWNAYAGVTAATPAPRSPEEAAADVSAQKPKRKHVASESEAPAKSGARKKSG